MSHDAAARQPGPGCLSRAVSRSSRLRSISGTRAQIRPLFARCPTARPKGMTSCTTPERATNSGMQQPPAARRKPPNARWHWCCLPVTHLWCPELAGAERAPEYGTGQHPPNAVPCPHHSVPARHSRRTQRAHVLATTGATLRERLIRALFRSASRSSAATTCRSTGREAGTCGAGTHGRRNDRE